MRTTKYRGAAAAISTIVLAVLFTLLLIIQLPSTARADENLVGIEVTIGDRDGGDLSIAGVDIRIDTDNARDISAVGVEVVMEGAASGDVSIAAADLTINADIGGDLSAAGASIDVTSQVSGDVSLAGAEVRFSGSGDDVHLLGGEVYLDGVVHGDLHVRADEFHVTPETVISGNFEFKGDHEPDLPEGLTIGGTYTYEFVEYDDIFDGHMPIAFVPVVAIAGVVGALTLLVLLPVAVLIGGGILILLMTGLTARTIDGIRQRPLSSLGMGIVVLIGLMVIAVLLCITIIGIPLALAILFFYPFLLLLGFIVATLGIPYLVLRRSPNDTGAFAKVALFFVSLLALGLLFSIPGLGQIIFSVVILMGVGAFGAAVLGRRKEQTA